MDVKSAINVEIIVIGHEILDGRRVDSNSSWLGRELSAIGLKPRFKQSVVDTKEDIESALTLAFSRADLVLTSGGLGPTSDDLTFESLAKSLNQELVYHADIEDNIKQRFLSSQHEYVSSNRKQALLPAQTEALKNDLGTAPGLWYEHMYNGKKVYGACFPGVPSELEHIFDTSVKQRIKNHLVSGGDVVNEKIYSLVGLSESAFAQKVDLMFSDIAHLKISYTASYPVLDVTFSAYDTQMNQDVFVSVHETFEQECSDFIVAKDGKNIEEEVCSLLKQNTLKVSFAESCTGGLLAAQMLNVPGASAVFEESIVCYSNESKMNRLGVKPETLKTYGAVSAQCALEMAVGAQKEYKADIVVAVTGIAGPDGGSDEKPVGLVYIAINCSPKIKKALLGSKFEDMPYTYEFQFKKDRMKNRQAAVMKSLQLLQKLLKCLK